MNDPRLLSKRKLDELRASIRDDTALKLLDHIDAQEARIKELAAELRECDQGDYDLSFPEPEQGKSKSVRMAETRIRPDFELESEDE